MTEKEKEKTHSGQGESEERRFPEGSVTGEGEAEEGATEVIAPPEVEKPVEKKVEIAEIELAELRKKAVERDEFMDLLLRTRADFSNYQKRMKREMELTGRYASQEVVKALIPAMDHLSRAIKSAEGANSENLNKFLEGLRLIQNEFLKALEGAGLRSIEPTLGQPFNPELHEAFLEEENVELPHHTILELLEPGFVLHDRVIKPAKVKVSRRPVSAEERPLEVATTDKEAPKARPSSEEK
jgi:molecular chaperone GrpE